MLARLVGEGALEIRGRSSYRVPGGVSVTVPEGLEPWRVYGERTLYDNRWVTLHLWNVEPPEVERFEHHVVKLHRVAIAAVPDDQDRVLMLWRYRFFVPGQWGGNSRARYVEPDGTERSKSFPDKQKRLAETWLTQVAADMARGQYVDPSAGKVTFQPFAAQWLASQTTDPSTLEAMELRFRLHAFPPIGSRSLSAFQPGHIHTWARALKDSGIARHHRPQPLPCRLGEGAQAGPQEAQAVDP